ncbi:hypothetical protein [Wolbachia endosymbiont (group E) of Neria commutata]|uniref:hypothetical protein n=1 Tax=Wolbachia endosymbiont (group E) of Neria commutata TaxID=3066149 RepID=UPI003132ABDC
MPGFSFKKQNGIDSATGLGDTKVIIYEDASSNKYTFGVDGSDVFNTFKYEPSSGVEVDYSALATQFMSVGGVNGLLGAINAINTNVGTINANVGTINTKVGTIETTVGTVNANVGSSPLAPMFTGLAHEATLTTLDGKVDAIKTQTNLIPADLTARLDALNLADANAQGTLGKALSELAKAQKLSELDTKVGNLIPANLTERLNALNPADTSGGLGQALKGIQDKTDKLDLADSEDTLGGALGKLETGLTIITGHTTTMSREFTSLLQGQGLDISSAGNENMLGEYSPDQFLG